MSCSSCCILHKCDNDLCAGVVSQSQVSSPVSVSIFSSVSISGCGCFSGSDSVSGYSLGPHPLLLGKYGHLNNCAAQAASVPSLPLFLFPLPRQTNKQTRRRGAPHTKTNTLNRNRKNNAPFFLHFAFSLCTSLLLTHTHAASYIALAHTLQFCWQLCAGIQLVLHIYLAYRGKYPEFYAEIWYTTPRNTVRTATA